MDLIILKTHIITHKSDLIVHPYEMKQHMRGNVAVRYSDKVKPIIEEIFPFRGFIT